MTSDHRRSAEPDPTYDGDVEQVERAKVKGEQVFASVRRSVSERLAELIRSDPSVAAQAAEFGLVDRAWLEDPTAQPFRTAPPQEVVQRFLERMAEQRPSVLASVGLSALQGLSMVRADPEELGSPTSLTVVFTDMEGFTRYTTEHGDEAAAVIVADHQRVVGPIIRSRGGRVVKRLGDGLMLTFSAPEAALLASLEMVDTYHDHPLRLRAGLHVGDALVTHDDLVGHVVNVAARITEVAAGDQVLASVDVRSAVGDMDRVRFGRARRMKLKGVDPISVCQVEAV